MTYCWWRQLFATNCHDMETINHNQPILPLRRSTFWLMVDLLVRHVAENGKMYEKDEKLQFSQRLQALLASVEVKGPTELALKFNLRHAGQSVSMQAVHKWLNGTAIPSADKILTLAKWLKADPHWLRHGSPEAMQQRLDAHPEPQFNFSAEDVALLETFQRLDAGKKRLVKELLRVISQEQAAQ